MAFNNNLYHLHVSKGGGGVYSVKRSMFNSIYTFEVYYARITHAILATLKTKLTKDFKRQLSIKNSNSLCDDTNKVF